jgi:hypothetical protein
MEKLSAAEDNEQEYYATSFFNQSLAIVNSAGTSHSDSNSNSQLGIQCASNLGEMVNSMTKLSNFSQAAAGSIPSMD